MADGAVHAGGDGVGVWLWGWGGEVDVGGGGGLGEAVAFHGADAEFFLEGVCEVLREFFGSGDDEIEGLEEVWIDALHVAAQEGGGGEEDVDLVEGDEFCEALCLEGGGVGDEVDAFYDGVPEGDGAAEGVEEGEAAEEGGVSADV